MIRLKIFSAIVLSTLILSAILYTVSNVVIMQSFEKIEAVQLERNLVRVESSFNDRLNTLKIKLTDWATWDDTYYFVQDRNTDYIDSNLADSSLVNLEVNFMLFLDQNNDTVFAKQVDLETQSEVPSEALIGEIVRHPELIPNSEEGVSGFLKLNQGTLLIMSLPILQSSGEGPVAGTLVFGRFLDEQFVSESEDLTQLSIDVFTSTADMQQDVLLAEQELRSKDAYYAPLSFQSIAGYFKLTDIQGEPIGIVKITTPREITQQGITAIKFFMLLSGTAIVLFGLVVLLLLEHFLLRRFAQLTREMNGLSVSDLRHAHVHVHVGKHDDVGRLASVINDLLQKLSSYQLKEAEEMRQQKEVIEADKEFNENLRKSLEEKASMNKLMVERELKMIELKKEIKRLEDQLKHTTSDM